MKQRFFRVERCHHAYLTFIAEAHDGLCSISTVDNGAGIVRITAPQGREEELYDFIGAMIDELAMEEVRWPVC